MLIDKNRRYVGQASGAVAARLRNHDRGKDWWSELVFFTRTDGYLDKSQLDHLEASLIKEFQRKGFAVDNGKAGNTSHIEPYQKGKADALLSSGLNMLQEAAKVNIFAVAKASSLGTAPAPANSRRPGRGYRVFDTEGREVMGRSRRVAYTSYLSRLLAEDGHAASLIRDEAISPTRKNFLVTEGNIEEGRRRLHLPLREGIWAYYNLSTESIHKHLAWVTILTGVEVHLDESC